MKRPEKACECIWQAWHFGLLVVLDQFTKYAAETYLKESVRNRSFPVFLNCLSAESRSGLWYFGKPAVGFRDDYSRWSPWLYVYVYLPVTLHFLAMRICTVLIAAGAAGNMIDRLLHRYVIDFLLLLIVLIFTLYRNDNFECLNPGKE